MEPERLLAKVRQYESFALPNNNLEAAFLRFQNDWKKFKSELEEQEDSWRTYYIDEINSLATRALHIRLQFEESMNEEKLLSGQEDAEKSLSSIDDEMCSSSSDEMAMDTQQPGRVSPMDQSIDTSDKKSSPKQAAATFTNTVAATQQQSSTLPSGLVSSSASPSMNLNLPSSSKNQPSAQQLAIAIEKVNVQEKPNDPVNEQPGSLKQPQLQAISTESTASAHSSALTTEDTVQIPVTFSTENVNEVAKFFDRLRRFPVIPETVRPEHIRALRSALNDVVHYLQRSNNFATFERRSYEPILLAFVIGAMSSGMQSVYQHQFYRSNVNIAIMRDFLADTEEKVADGFHFQEPSSATKRQKTSSADVRAGPSRIWSGSHISKASVASNNASQKPTGAIPKVKRAKSKAKKVKKFRHCLYCADLTHLMYNCDLFKLMTFAGQMEYISDKGICLNCLRGFHKVEDFPN